MQESGIVTRTYTAYGPLVTDLVTKCQTEVESYTS